MQNCCPTKYITCKLCDFYIQFERYNLIFFYFSATENSSSSFILRNIPNLDRQWKHFMLAFVTHSLASTWGTRELAVTEKNKENKISNKFERTQSCNCYLALLPYWIYWFFSHILHSKDKALSSFQRIFFCCCFCTSLRRLVRVFAFVLPSTLNIPQCRNMAAKLYHKVASNMKCTCHSERLVNWCCHHLVLGHLVLWHLVLCKNRYFLAHD